MVRLNKRYGAAREVADLTVLYPLEDAVAILSKMPSAKFDESVELSMHLGVDPKQGDQMIRGIVNLPNGSGKKVRVAVFTESVEEALEAGADYAGLDDLVAQVKDGWLAFDVTLATPPAMQKVRSIARILGPRGLMPNPKSGTVTTDVAGTINDIKQGGRVEFRMDRTANLGVVVGKRSFAQEKLVENINTAIETIDRARPSSMKGRFILNMTLSSTMSPGIKLDGSILDTIPHES